LPNRAYTWQYGYSTVVGTLPFHMQWGRPWARPWACGGLSGRPTSVGTIGGLGARRRPRACPTVAFLVCVCAANAQQAPIGIVRGELLTWQAVSGAGELDVKTLEGRVYQCSFDRKTYFERDNQLVTPAAMATGDRLEIVSDRKADSLLCYARTVHVLDPTVVARLGPGGRPRFRREQSPTESFAPRGDMTFAGVVMRVDDDVLTLKTRADGEKVILLRQDTRYIGDGQRVEADGLKRNTRVFIRAGRNLDDDIEAYQVVWGKIDQSND
jgi:hypothetical protein